MNYLLKSMLSLTVLASLFNARVAVAEYANHVGIEAATDIIEVVDSLRIVLDTRSLTGFVEVPICNRGCVDTKLKITPDTIASENGKKVELKRARQRLGREVGIEYDVKSKVVTKIAW